MGFSFNGKSTCPIRYKRLQLDCAYEMDLVVEDAVIV